MAEKPTEKSSEPKRLNRLVGAGEALNRALDPALRKRGFASRDIITHWAAMAPAPYHQASAPDKLSWPRGEKGAEGAVLYLRCAASHRLQLAHEGERIAAAINRYFGYLLIGSVRLSTTPFSPHSAGLPQKRAEPAPATRNQVDHAVKGVADEDVKEALRGLGEAILGRKQR